MESPQPVHRDLVALDGKHYLVRRNRGRNILFVLARAEPFFGSRKLKADYGSPINHPDVVRCALDRDYLVGRNKYLLARLYPYEQLPATEKIVRADTVFLPASKAGKSKLL